MATMQSAEDARKQRWTKLRKVCRKAVNCSRCFDEHLVSPAHNGDLAHIRWIGPGYFASKPRVLVVMINPGQGRPAKGPVVKRHRHLKLFRQGKCSLENVLYRDGRGMSEWGGKFLRFFKGRLKLDFYSVAFANMAWCATKANKYPSAMLENCFEQHTEKLVQLLQPDRILLSGAKLKAFRKRLQGLVPEAKVLRIPHYAARRLNKDDLGRIKRARRWSRRHDTVGQRSLEK